MGRGARGKRRGARGKRGEGQKGRGANGARGEGQTGRGARGERRGARGQGARGKGRGARRQGGRGHGAESIEQHSVSSCLEGLYFEGSRAGQTHLEFQNNFSYLCKNLKYQITNYKQIIRRRRNQNSKSQTTIRYWKKEHAKLEKSKCLQLYLFWSLNIGICNLIGIWCLGFGIYQAN
jgi:hypothetical protein